MYRAKTQWKGGVWRRLIVTPIDGTCLSSEVTSFRYGDAHRSGCFLNENELTALRYAQTVSWMNRAWFGNICRESALLPLLAQ